MLLPSPRDSSNKPTCGLRPQDSSPQFRQFCGTNSSHWQDTSVSHPQDSMDGKAGQTRHGTSAPTSQWLKEGLRDRQSPFLQPGELKGTSTNSHGNRWRQLEAIHRTCDLLPGRCNPNVRGRRTDYALSVEKMRGQTTLPLTRKDGLAADMPCLSYSALAGYSKPAGSRPMRVRVSPATLKHKIFGDSPARHPCIVVVPLPAR